MPGPSGGARPSAAGASARAHYRALWSEHRRERALTHLIFAGTCGSITAAVFGWPVGVVVAAVAVPLSMIYVRVRPSPARRWRRGAAAERRTGRHLSRLDPAGFYVLHDRALPGDRVANLDHLVIGLTGVYAITTRRWRRGTGFRVEGRRLLIGGRPVSALVRTAGYAADVVSELLDAHLDYEVPVAAVVATHGVRLPRPGVRYKDVVFHRAERLPVVLPALPVVLTSAQVAEVAALVARCLPPMEEVDEPVGR